MIECLLAGSMDKELDPFKLAGGFGGQSPGLLSSPKLEMVERRHDKRVTNATGADEAWQLFHRHKAGDQILAVIEGCGVQQSAVLQEQGVAGVAHDRRVREDLADDHRSLAFVAGFLSQFTQAGDHGRLVRRVDHTARNFKFDRVRPVSVLFDHHEVAIRCERDDVDPVDTIDDVEIVRLTGPG